ncbi:MAG TPA: LLM class F420-dependent oxidoreductase [Gaiellales bacterium]
MPTPAREPVTRLGLQINSFTYPGVADADLFERIARIAVTAERSGFDSVWVMDHLYQIAVVGKRTEPMLEAYSLLCALAARTTRTQLGTMVTGVTYRNPALLAKMVTTLDVISQGRAILGIGAAWNEDEHGGYGFDFPPLRERFGRLEDAVQICRAMFTQDSPTFRGTHHHVDAVLNFPRPVRAGGPPILIGGSGEKRTIPMVARYADACNFFGDVETIRRKVRILEDSCEKIGRDPAEITKTRLGPMNIAATAAEAERNAKRVAAVRGLDEERVRGSFITGDPDSILEQVDAFIDAGLDGLLISLPDAHDIEPIELAGHTLAARLGSVSAV